MKSTSPLHSRNEELCWSKGRLPPNASKERKSVTDRGGQRFSKNCPNRTNRTQSAPRLGVSNSSPPAPHRSGGRPVSASPPPSLTRAQSRPRLGVSNSPHALTDRAVAPVSASPTPSLTPHRSGGVACLGVSNSLSRLTIGRAPVSASPTPPSRLTSQAGAPSRRLQLPHASPVRQAASLRPLQQDQHSHRPVSNSLTSQA
ncbi:hypothetical protein Syun_026018 [Stephania yunnanensis]|uniref:Uncharacterized protein n=1 Tax=Stephania yunnanensis TaxID=152371 RepID=A0AAP0EY80_9MAGN